MGPPEDAEAFEDILDGYFPLSLSIADLLARHALPAAHLRLSFAPILAVAGLPPDAPVPLNIRSGRAGIIDAAELWAVRAGCSVHLTGWARWRWLDGSEMPETLDPMIRLAEPAIVTIQTGQTGTADPLQAPPEGARITTRA